MRIAAAVELSPEQRQALEKMARGRSLPARVVERARVVLLAADRLKQGDCAADEHDVQLFHYRKHYPTPLTTQIQL